MNALKRAIKTMERYEQERERSGGYPTNVTDELLSRAMAYAMIAIAQEAAVPNRHITNPDHDVDYQP